MTTEPRDPAEVAAGARARARAGLPLTNGERAALELDLDRPEPLEDDPTPQDAWRALEAQLTRRAEARQAGTPDPIG